jgi:hypothetical protein
MANPLKGEAQLGDRTLAFDFGAFCTLEEKTGKKVPELMQALQTGLGFGELRDFAWAGLLKHHNMGEAEVVELLNEVGFQPTAEAVAKAITSFFGEQRAKAKNPPKAKQAGTG